MKKIAGVVAGVFLATVITFGQSPEEANKAHPTATPQSATAPSDIDLNLRAYIELLRSDVRKENAAVIGEVMQFDAADAAKFWPIYKEYEIELTRSGDEKLALIKKYADHYQNMTDAIADELARSALRLEQERHDLKAKYYERLKQSLGTIMAARFL
jgi:dsDNA-binding SOS-regulon protein